MYIQSGSQHLDEKFVEFHADTSIHRCTLYIILYDTHMNICIIWMRGDARGCEGMRRMREECEKYLGRLPAVRREGGGHVRI
jgi:hypothetical protein